MAITGKYRVLWIENGARFDVAHLAAAVFLEGGIDLITAEDVSTGVIRLLESEYDVVVVDIRLPPGDDPEWVRLYQELGEKQLPLRLGLDLLYTILGHPDAKIDLGSRRPVWITPGRLGILTVESKLEIQEDLARLGITVYEVKRGETPDEILLDLIRRVLSQADGQTMTTST